MKERFRPNAKWLIVALAVVLTGTVGCKTIPTDSATAFASGVTAVRSQSKETFSGANDLIADASLDYAASQSTLKEESFAAGLDSESLQAWDQALEKLEKYAQHLQALTSPELTKAFEDEAVNLSGELK